MLTRFLRALTRLRRAGSPAEVTAGVSVAGEVTCIVRDVAGAEVYRFTRINTVTDYFLGAVPKWCTGQGTNQYGVASPLYIALGTGTGTPSRTDKAMYNETAGTRQICSDRSVVSSTYAQYTAVYSTSAPRGTYTEAGLWDAGTGGNLCAHVLISVSLSAGQTLTVIWKIGFALG